VNSKTLGCFDIGRLANLHNVYHAARRTFVAVKCQDPHLCLGYRNGHICMEGRQDVSHTLTYHDTTTEREESEASKVHSFELYKV
jgi:hypothetical protein